MEKRVRINFLVSAGRRALPQAKVNRAKPEKPKNQNVGHWVTKLNPSWGKNIN